MIELIAGLKERCDRYATLKHLQEVIKTSQERWNETHRDIYIAEITKNRYALGMVLDVLAEIGVISEAEKALCERHYGCNE